MLCFIRLNHIFGNDIFQGLYSVQRGNLVNRILGPRLAPGPVEKVDSIQKLTL